MSPESGTPPRPGDGAPESKRISLNTSVGSLRGDCQPLAEFTRSCARGWDASALQEPGRSTPDSLPHARRSTVRSTSRSPHLPPLHPARETTIKEQHHD